MNLAPAELVFVTMTSTPDLTGPFIGIGGVVLGSLAAFLSLRHQLRQQRLYDLMKLCANLIAAGEELRDDYLAKKDTRIDVLTMPAWLSLMEAKKDEMLRIQRHAELLAKEKLADAAEDYVGATVPYLNYSHALYGSGRTPDDNLLAKTYESWEEARQAFLDVLKSKGGRDVV